MAEIVRRPQHQEPAQIVAQPARRSHQTGEPTVFRTAYSPDQTEDEQHHDEVAGGAVDADPPFRRDEPGEQRDGDCHGQQPVKQPRREVPDIDPKGTQWRGALRRIRAGRIYPAR